MTMCDSEICILNEAYEEFRGGYIILLKDFPHISALVYVTETPRPIRKFCEIPRLG